MSLLQRSIPIPTEPTACHNGVPMLSQDRCRPTPADPSPAFCMTSFAAAADGQNPRSFRHTGRDSRTVSCRRGAGVLLFWRSPHATQDYPPPSGRLPDRLIDPTRVLLPLDPNGVRRSQKAMGRAGLLRSRRSQGHAAGVPPLERQAKSLQKHSQNTPRKLLLRTKD